MASRCERSKWRKGKGMAKMLRRRRHKKANSTLPIVIFYSPQYRHPLDGYKATGQTKETTYLKAHTVW